MKIEGQKTYWGADLVDEVDEKTKRLLGRDMELHTPGDDADKTDARKEALEIVQDPQREGRNARQTMLMHKEAHGSGIDLVFPDAAKIDASMTGYDQDHMVDVYGDGSLTTPTKWWVALGGYGVWVPDWNRNAEILKDRMEQNLYGQAIGQTGRSTRQELTARILVLSMPIRSMYATDSASMLSKAKVLLAAAKKKLEAEGQGNMTHMRNPFKKPWGSRTREACGNMFGKRLKTRSCQPRFAQGQRPCDCR